MAASNHRCLDNHHPPYPGQTHERAYALNRRSVWPKNTNWGLIGDAFHKFPTSIARIRRVNSIIFLYKDFMRLPCHPTHLHRMQSDLVKRDMDKNQARFYAMAVLPDLFGEWTLRQEWGRIGAHGQIRLDLFRSHTEAEDALLTLENRKRRRGILHGAAAIPAVVKFQSKKPRRFQGLPPRDRALIHHPRRGPTHVRIAFSFRNYAFHPSRNGAFFQQYPPKPPRSVGCGFVR